MRSKTTSKKIIPLESAHRIANQIAAGMKGSVSEREEKIYEILVQACPPVELGGDSYILLDLFEGFLKNFIKAVEEQDSSYLFQKRGYRFSRIPDIQEFAESKEFFKTKLWPAQLEFLWELHCSGNYYEVGLLTGATSAGKSTIVRISVGYQLMLANSLHNPQLEYGFAPGTDMTFALQSITQDITFKVLFHPLYTLVTSSPWFVKNSPPDKDYKSELRFKNGIFCRYYGGADTAVLGQDLVSIAATELNRAKYIEHSKKVAGGGDYDQALEIVETAGNRIKGRTLQMGGKIPGFILIDAAREFPGDFTSKKMEEAKHDPHMLVYNKTQWDARGFMKGRISGGGRYCGDVFYVEVGDEDRDSRILVNKEQARSGAKILEVPVEHRREFETDCDMALRDFAGEVTGGVRRYIPWTADINEAAKSFADVTGDRQLFMVPEICLNTFVEENGIEALAELVNTRYVEELLVGGKQEFAGHIDLGLKYDAAGLAFGHVAAYRHMNALRIIDSKSGDMREVKDVAAPIYQIDGLMRVVAPPGGEIDFDLLEELVMVVKGLINIVVASFDGFQSTHFIQRLRKAKIKSGVLSVDATLGPIGETKMAIRQHRIWYPGHPVLLKEFRELEYDPDKQKVDHPPHGSKDLADAVAGCTYLLLTRLSQLRRTQRTRGDGEADTVKRIRGRVRNRTPFGRGAI